MGFHSRAEGSCVTDYSFRLWKQHLEVTDFAVKRKWKWQFMNGCEYKSPVSTTAKFLNPCEDETDASVCLYIFVKNNDISLEQTSYI